MTPVAFPSGVVTVTSLGLGLARANEARKRRATVKGYMGKERSEGGD